MASIQQPAGLLTNENGFALISTLLILAILTFIGLAATSTTNFEIKIAGNQREAHQRFDTADSGWKQAGPFLNAKAAPPKFINLTLKSGDSSYDWNETQRFYRIVRNFGDGPDGDLNEEFPTDDIDGSISSIPYWYRVYYLSNSKALDFGEGYRDFQYEVTSNAQGTTEVITQVRKVFRVGY